MAFLDQTHNRPSCVVSALPKRFRESLARDLAGTVALTTCSVDELEATVRTRGATMAIVGASSNSTEVAERLSHDARSVKVFLAHYQEARRQSAPLNGFAGVFDLRSESERLAATIKQAATLSVRTPSFGKPRRARLLSHFIDMQKRLGNRTALCEMLLDGFLSITDADEGMLLLPDDAARERFRIVASQGDHLPALTEEVILEPFCHRALLDGHLVTNPEEIRFSTTLALPFLPRFALAAPISVAGQLVGCLIGDRGSESEALEEFIMGASFLFQQLAKREQAARRDRMIVQARQSASPGWMLVDARDRILYREASESFPISSSATEIKEPRIRDAIARAHLGKSGSIQVRENMISYRPLEFGERPCCLLTAKPTYTERESTPIDFPSSDALLAAFKTQPAFSSKELGLVENLCQDSSVDGEAGEEIKVSVKILAPLGITFVGNPEEIPPPLSRGISLLLLASRLASQQLVTGRFHRQNNEWFLTVETKEDHLSDSLSAWTRNPLIKMTLQLLSTTEMQIGTYGFQAKGLVQ